MGGEAVAAQARPCRSKGAPTSAPEHLHRGLLLALNLLLRLQEVLHLLGKRVVDGVLEHVDANALGALLLVRLRDHGVRERVSGRRSRPDVLKGGSLGLVRTTPFRLALARARSLSLSRTAQWLSFSLPFSLPRIKVLAAYENGGPWQ